MSDAILKIIAGLSGLVVVVGVPIAAYRWVYKRGFFAGRKEAKEEAFQKRLEEKETEKKTETEAIKKRLDDLEQERLNYPFRRNTDSDYYAPSTARK